MRDVGPSSLLSHPGWNRIHNGKTLRGVEGPLCAGVGVPERFQ